MSLSLLDAAKAARSYTGLLNVHGRAQKRAALWTRQLARWPAMVEFAQKEADEIEALVRQRSQ